MLNELSYCSVKLMSGGQRTISNSRRFPIPLTHNHSFPRNRVLALIKDSLDLVPSDPIPKIIIIKQIRIFQVEEDKLEIHCDMVYET